MGSDCVNYVQHANRRIFSFSLFFWRTRRLEKCYRCLFIVQKHANVLQYKESKSPMPSSSRYLIRAAFLPFLDPTGLTACRVEHEKLKKITKPFPTVHVVEPYITK